ncbi:MAG: hypothetical protein R2827_11880 [Bdellovibrionales bacterium]
MISIAASTKNSVNIEYSFLQVSQGQLQPLWQQFKNGKNKNGMRVTEGFILTSGMTNPEKLTGDHLQWICWNDPAGSIYVQ